MPFCTDYVLTGGVIKHRQTNQSQVIAIPGLSVVEWWCYSTGLQHGELKLCYFGCSTVSVRNKQASLSSLNLVFLVPVTKTGLAAFQQTSSPDIAVWWWYDFAEPAYSNNIWYRFRLPFAYNVPRSLDALLEQSVGISIQWLCQADLKIYRGFMALCTRICRPGRRHPRGYYVMPPPVILVLHHWATY